MPFRIGPWEIAIILVLILIVFGVGKLPEVGGAIGKGIRQFRQSRDLDYREDKPTADNKKGTADKESSAL